MKKRALGKSGFEVTEIGFGAWAIGGRGYGEVSEQQAYAVIEAYLEGGGNFIDTARRYGESERRLGEVLRRSGTRDQVYLATKTHQSRSKETLPEIRKELEESLRLMQTDVVDLFYMHAPPEEVDVMNFALDEFAALKKEGKIRAIGASIKGPDVTRKTVDLCRQYVDSGRIDAIQLIYSVFRQMNAESIAYAKNNGVGIVARTVMESGFLTGSYRPGDAFADNDHRRRWQGAHLDELLAEAVRLSSTAVRPPYSSLAQVAIRFALAQEGVSTVIAGAKRVEQMRANLAVDAIPPLENSLLEELRRDYADFTAKANTG
jgi:aryl-alcohol dehydrogenase-like predicted oxidoreductase